MGWNLASAIFNFTNSSTTEFSDNDTESEFFITTTTTITPNCYNITSSSTELYSTKDTTEINRNLTNSSSVIDKDEDAVWETWQIVLVTIPMTALILEIIFGNLLVIVAILWQRSLRTPSNMIILSLAVADLAVGIFILPFNVADMICGWRFGVVLCRIWLTSDVTLCSTSILHISAIAVDRFRSINEGVSYATTRTMRMSLIVCGALWLIALWIASSPVLGWNDWNQTNQTSSDDKMKCELTRKLGYIIHSASGAFFIPALIMVGLYVRIFLLLQEKFRDKAKMSCLSYKSKTTSKLDAIEPDCDHSSADIIEDASTDATKESVQQTKWKKTVDLTSCEESSPSTPQTRKKHSEQIDTILKAKIRFSLSRERKAAKTLGVIIGAFIICWTPFTLVYLASGVLVELNPTKGIPLWLFQTVTWLGYVNSGLNPIIYTIYNPEFRRAFRNILEKLYELILCKF